jgi:hypothetical protein
MIYSILWALVGWGLASWVIILLSLPDPPPDIWKRFVVLSIAGIVGGLVGGLVVNGAISSDPMPALAGSNPMPGRGVATLLGAASVALVLTAGAALALGRRASH